MAAYACSMDMYWHSAGKRSEAQTGPVNSIHLNTPISHRLTAYKAVCPHARAQASDKDGFQKTKKARKTQKDKLSR